MALPRGRGGLHADRRRHRDEAVRPQARGASPRGTRVPRPAGYRERPAMSEPSPPPPPPPRMWRRDPDFVAHAEFEVFLDATPRPWVVRALIAANVVAFVAMTFWGNTSLVHPATRDVAAWGGNWGPATLGGEPWRLLTSEFLHFGAVHLVGNMVVLWYAVRPDAAFAGASGAIFGVFGALGGYLLRERRSVPRPVLESLRAAALAYLVLDVLFEAVAARLSVAAHLGGLVAGFVAGTLLARPLVPDRSRG